MAGGWRDNSHLRQLLETAESKELKKGLFTDPKFLVWEGKLLPVDEFLPGVGIIILILNRDTGDG